MGNLVNLPNINPSSLVIDNKTKTTTQESAFDTRNYLSLRLDEGETEKTIPIRLLPIEPESSEPWKVIHMHTNITVPKTLVSENQKPFKSYICAHTTEGLDREKFEDKCPFCEMRQYYWDESCKTTDPIQRKSLRKESCKFIPRDAVIMRCIERGKEDEGVKFLLVKLRDDKTDICNQIINLYNLRSEAAKRKGTEDNILDIYKGRDLYITIHADGTAAPTVVDDSDRSPLSENEEQMKAWIYDSKRPFDVFGIKPYDYLSLVLQMKHPYKVKAGTVLKGQTYEKDTWIDKAIIDEEKNTRNNTSKSEVDNAQANIDRLNAEAAKATSVPSPAQATTTAASILSSMMVNDDDLPL